MISMLNQEIQSWEQNMNSLKADLDFKVDKVKGNIMD